VIPSYNENDQISGILEEPSPHFILQPAPTVKVLSWHMKKFSIYNVYSIDVDGLNENTIRITLS
jgi:hypothetical protein